MCVSMYQCDENRRVLTLPGNFKCQNKLSKPKTITFPFSGDIMLSVPSRDLDARRTQFQNLNLTRGLFRAVPVMERVATSGKRTSQNLRVDKSLDNKYYINSCVYMHDTHATACKSACWEFASSLWFFEQSSGP